MIIGLCGQAGCGKSTAAGILEREGFVPLALAQPLYDALAAITGVPAETLQRRDIKEKPLAGIGKSPRYLLQTLGTEWGRNLVGETVWIDILMRKIDELRADGRSVTVADVRFDDEAQAIIDAGGSIWRIYLAEHWIGGSEAYHPSEAGISQHLISRRIYNDNDLERFASGVLEALAAERQHARLHASTM